mgnify:CR=1 FL=1
MIEFSIANSIFFIGTLFLIKNVLENKDNLNGFSLNGSILTATGMVFMSVGFLRINDIITFLISIPTLLFWAVVTFYLIRRKNENSTNSK